MTPDVNIRDYYLKFVGNAKNDIISYTKKIKSLIIERDKLFDIIFENADLYRKNYNIAFSDYTKEFIDKAYDKSENLPRRVRTYIREEISSNNRIKLYKILAYCEILKSIYDYNKMITIASNRKNLKFKEYRNLVTKYYNQVHKEVLQGYGYKFNYGIGVFCICRWKLQESKNSKSKLDYDATKKAKQELIAQGKKLYNPLEAKWYANRNIPYDGIDYRVYTKCTHIYDINIIKSELFAYKNHKFEHAEHVSKKVRGKSYKQMADECNSLDDIVNYPVDIRYKLNMLLYKDPSSYILYIRNNEQDRFEHGAHNS